MAGNGRKRSDGPKGNGGKRSSNGQFTKGNTAAVGHKKPEQGIDFGAALRRVAMHQARDFPWSKKLADDLGLEDQILICDLMAHGALNHGYEGGRAPYFTEAIQRMFGKVPDRIEADINVGMTDEQQVRAQRIADMADAIDD